MQVDKVSKPLRRICDICGYVEPKEDEMAYAILCPDIKCGGHLVRMPKSEPIVSFGPNYDWVWGMRCLECFHEACGTHDATDVEHAAECSHGNRIEGQYSKGL